MHVSALLRPGPAGPRVRASRPHRVAAGFTIIEVMFAATIMLMAISTSVVTLQRMLIVLDSARKVTVAAQVMQSEIERMRLDDWTVINAYPASSDLTSTIAANFGASSAITSTFTLTRTVADVRTDLKRITLTASWRGYDGRTFSRSYITYYGKNGLYDYVYNSY